MLRVLGSSNPWRESMSRREVMHIGGLGALGLSLPSLLRAQETDAVDPAPRAKKILLLYLQ
ncbi:MAG TPA: DUF1501 domain-containing protein, partial [Caulifigura sp.]|nr:DUF1501 domain-containing protein [Caulifigura sp.]